MKRGRIGAGVYVWAVIFLFFGSLIAGCKNKATNINGIPEKLVIGEFGGENPGRTREVMGQIAKCMQQDLGIPVEVYLSTDYTAIIEGIHAKKVDIAYFGAFSYIIAAQGKDIEPIAILGVDGKPFMYHSNIFVQSNSGLNSMADVKSRSKNLTFCFTDPASTSGHLIPRAYLNSIGLEPTTSFKETLFAGSHAASILTVAAGKVDVGCATDDYGINMMIKQGLIKQGDLKVLWVSDPIVGSPIVVRKDMNKKLAGRIQQFYFDMAQKHPGDFQKYIRFYYVNAPANLTYIGARDTLFDRTRKIAENIKDLKLVN